MQDLIQALIKELKVDSAQATGGAAVLFKAAREKMGTPEFSQLLGKLPGIENLISQAPAAGGMGKLFGGFASALGGGNAALLANVLSGFSKLGLTQAHAQQFVPVVLKFLQAKLGKAAAEKLEKALRA